MNAFEQIASVFLFAFSSFLAHCPLTIVTHLSLRLYLYLAFSLSFSNRNKKKLKLTSNWVYYLQFTFNLYAN